MKTKIFGLIALAVASVAVLAVACGGGEEAAAIRIQRGLAVAALAPGSGGEETAASGGDYAASGASSAMPAAAISTTSGRGGDMGFASLVAQQQGMTGIFVQGFGSATADATSAQLQLFVVGGQGYYPKGVVLETGVEEPGSTPIVTPPLPSPSQPQPLTEEDLAPIIAAIKAQGIAEGDIEVNMNPGGYYDPYSPGRASITVTISNPRDRVQPIVDAARDAASASGTLYLESVNVFFSVSPETCTTLERESMQAAVEDAGDRAQLLAQVLGVGIGNVVFASHYSYSPFGPSPCDPAAIGYPKGDYSGYPYDPSQPAEVTLISNVNITYAIQ